MVDTAETVHVPNDAQAGEQKNRNAGIDQFRFFAFVGVFFVHFADWWVVKFGVDQLPVGIAVLSFAGRFAVPFFFLLAGYFLKPTLEALQGYTRRLLVPFLFWEAVYLIQDWFIRGDKMIGDISRAGYDVRLFVNGGEAYHLWFFTSLFFCIVFLTLLNRVFSPKIAVMIAAMFFAVGLVFDPYAHLILGVDGIPNMRDGPFFGLLFLALGHYAKPFLERATLRFGAAMLFLGCVVFVLEAFFLRDYFGSPILEHNALIGCVPVALGGFIVARRFPFSSETLTYFGRISLGLYAVHVFFFHVFFPLFRQPNFGAILALCAFIFLCSAVVAIVLNQFKLTRPLVS